MTLAHSPAAHTQPGTADTVADILTAAADLIEPEGRWTQGAFARTAMGNVIGSYETPAVCFCAVGAVYRAAHGRGPYSTSRALDLLAETVGRDQIDEWNDDPKRTQPEVVGALRAAAEKARTKSAVGTTVGREPKIDTTREGADR